MPERTFRVTLSGSDAPTIGVFAAALHRLARDRDFVFSVGEVDGQGQVEVVVLEQLAVVHLLDGQQLASEVDAQRVCQTHPQARLIVAVDAEGGRRVVKNNTGTEVVFDGRSYE